MVLQLWLVALRRTCMQCFWRNTILRWLSLQLIHRRINPRLICWRQTLDLESNLLRSNLWWLVYTSAIALLGRSLRDDHFLWCQAKAWYQNLWLNLVWCLMSIKSSLVSTKWSLWILLRWSSIPRILVTKTLVVTNYWIRDSPLIKLCLTRLERAALR